MHLVSRPIGFSHTNSMSLANGVAQCKSPIVLYGSVWLAVGHFLWGLHTDGELVWPNASLPLSSMAVFGVACHRTLVLLGVNREALHCT